MIEELYLKGFRGVAEGEMSGLAQINLLVGPNNAGKTTILEALYLAAAADVECQLGTDEGDFWPVLAPAEADMLGLDPLARMWKRHGFPARWDKGSEMVRWDDGNIRLKLPAALQDCRLLTRDDPLTKTIPREQEQRMAMLAAQLSDEGQILPAVERYFGERGAPWEGKRFVFTWFGPFTYWMRGLGGWYVSGEMPGPAMTLFYDSQVAAEHLPAALIERGHHTTDWLQRIGQHFSAVSDLPGGTDVAFDPAETDPTRRIGFVKAGGIMHSIDTWGDGARHVFKLLAPLVIFADKVGPERPGLLLWEAPELFMNPQTLGRMLRTVIEIIGDKQIQLFMCTQSIEVLAYLTEMLQRGEIDRDAAMVFGLALKEGQLQSSWLDADDLVTWLETGWDPRTLGEFTGPLHYSLWEEQE